MGGAVELIRSSRRLTTSHWSSRNAATDRHVRVSDVATVQDSVENLRNSAYARQQAVRAGHHLASTRRQYHRYGRSYPSRCYRKSQRRFPIRSMWLLRWIQTVTIRASVRDTEQRTLLILISVMLRRARRLLLSFCSAFDDDPKRRGAGHRWSAPLAPCICWATTSTTCR